MLTARGVAVLATALCVVLVWLGLRARSAPASALADYPHLDVLAAATDARRAIVSTLYSDSYAIAAAVLLHSVKTHNTSATHFFLAYLPGRVSDEALCVVRAAGWQPLPVPFIPPPHPVPHHSVDQYTKLNIWAVPASRALYLAPDTLVRRNIDELFALPWSLAAAPHIDVDAGDFDPAVMAYAPDPRVLARMHAALPTAHGAHAFLNAFFAASAARLPCAYNADLALKRARPALWRALAPAVVHYSLVKPFRDPRDPTGRVLRGAERVGHVLDEAEAAYAGMFRDEVRWWRDAYVDMLRGRVGAAIERCSRDALVV